MNIMKKEIATYIQDHMIANHIDLYFINVWLNTNSNMYYIASNVDSEDTKSCLLFYKDLFNAKDLYNEFGHKIISNTTLDFVVSQSQMQKILKILVFQ